MNKTSRVAIALGVAIPFGVVTLLDPKEAIDNPHTHQEAPTAPTLDSPAPILNTFTGTKGTIAGDAKIQFVLSKAQFS